METPGGKWPENFTLIDDSLMIDNLSTLFKDFELQKQLFWNKELIIGYLKENHVKIGWSRILRKKNWKFLLDANKGKDIPNNSLEGSTVGVTLPSVWKFKWFTAKYFISNTDIDRGDFDAQKVGKISCKREDIVSLLESIRDYMDACWVKIDTNMDYSRDLAPGSNTRWCAAGDIAKELLNLHDGYFWLKDTDEDGFREQLSSVWKWHYHFRKSRQTYAEWYALAKVQ